MTERISVSISAKDDASRVFGTIASSATKMGDALEAAAKEGETGFRRVDQAADTAKKSLQDVEREAIDADRAMRDVGDSAQRASFDFDKMGAAIVAVGGFLTVAGNSAIDQMQIMDGLRRQFGETADEYIQLADTIAANSIFNDDDIMRGMQYFAVLREEYDLTDQQLQDLMQTTADLATVRGTTFEDASSRITGAIRGEAEAAEYLGLSLQQSAIDRQNLTLTMTNQERAQFQLNALNEQAAYAQGAASAALDSDVGKRAALTNAIQDNTQAVGNFLGPYNAMIAGLATGAVGVAQFAGGFGALVTGIRAATSASLAFVATPIGATVTLLAAGLAIATGEFLQHRSEADATRQAWEDAAASAATLDERIRSLALIDWGAGNWARNLSQNVAEEIDWQVNYLRETLLQSFGTGNWFDEMVLGSFDGGIPPMQLGELQAVWEERANELIDAMIPDAADRERFTDAMADLLSLQGTVGDTAFAAIQNEAQRLFDAFNAADGAITIEQFIGQLEYLYSANLQAAQGIDAATIALNEQAAAQGLALTLTDSSIMAQIEYATVTDATTAAIREQALAEREAMNARGQAAQEAEDRAQEREDDRRARWEAEEAAFLEKEAAIEAARENRENGERQAHLAEGQRQEERFQRYQEDEAAFDELVESRKAAARELIASFMSVMGADNPLDQWNMAGLGSGASAAAAGLNDAAAAAENLFRVIVGNTNAIASQADATLQWADELIGAEGQVAVIDDLLNAHIITWDEYTAAQEAYNSIAQDTASIQSYVSEIQAMQAPLIAESTSALENQMETISRMPAEQQLVALAWMDSATAAKAFEVQALASSAAMGELGANGEASVTRMIEGLIAADPALEALLVDMGLINVAVDEFGNKTISVNFDGASEANQIMQDLTQSIIMLTDVLDDGEINGSVSLEDNATPVIESVIDRLAFWDNSSGDADATVTDNASGPIAAIASRLADLDASGASPYATVADSATGTLANIQALLNSIDGRTATTYVKTVYSTSGTGLLGDRPFAMGGVIPGYADGGVLFRGAEAGPELLHFATGGVAPIFHDGLYTAPPGTYVSPAPANPGLSGGGGVTAVFNNYAPIYGVDDLDARFRDFAVAIRDESMRHRIASGVMA